MRCNISLLVGVLSLGSLGLLSGCGGEEPPIAKPAEPPAGARGVALERATSIQSAVGRWAGAPTLADAKAGAEEARNLVTGPDAPGAGDGDGDGAIERVSVGLLPGENGDPGLASPVPGRCVQRDVLGGSWSEPRARWAEVIRRIERWTPSNNTFPALPSHAQRVVGRASLTLEADRLADARELSGHATGHADIVVEALRAPRATPCAGG